MINVTIIIPTYKRTSILKRSLQEIAGYYGKHDFEVLVVNDDSETPINLSDFPFVKVYNNPGKGVASARNFGARQANSQWLLFIDDDIILPEHVYVKIYDRGIKDTLKIYFPNWHYTPEMQKVLDKSIFGKYMENAGLTSLKGYINNPSWSDNEVFQITGGASYCLFIGKELFDSTNGYNENFRFAGFEDYDLPARLIQKGVSFFCDPTILVLHNESDRLDVSAWLDRQERGAITRHTAVTLGYKELDPAFGNLKKAVYAALSPCYSLFHFSFLLINNFLTLKFVGFRLMNVMTGIRFYKGYYKKQNHENS